MSRMARLLTLCMLVASAAVADAQQIDLSLNVIHSNPNNPASNGTWQLVAKSNTAGVQGIMAVGTALTGINASVNNAGPRGIVNGGPCTDFMTSGCAGFYNFAASSHPGYVDIFASQAPIGFLGPGDEEGLFYGVGTLTNGAPNYPGKPMGSNSIGPAFTSLTNVTGVPWATGDVFSNPTWNIAAILATGTFNAGMTPGFYGPGLTTGAVFTSLPPNNTSVGAIDSSVTFTKIVRTNLIVATNDGDYNNDGVVNAADFVLWRDTLGKAVTSFAEADGSGNGLIDTPDYTFWRARFGNLSPGSGAGAGSAMVPEPATWVLAVFAAGLALAATRSGARRKWKM